jgi:hypothetical protein
MTMDEALAGMGNLGGTFSGTKTASKVNPALTSSIGGYHLMDQLDGIDAAIPLEEDVIILEDSDDGAIEEEPVVDTEAIKFGFGGTFGGTADSFLMSSNSGTRRSSTKGGTFGRSGTLGRLGAEIRDDEVFQETTQSAPITESNSLDEEDDENDLDVIIITRHLLNFRRYGYLICAIYITLCAVITYLNTAGWAHSTLSTFWRIMIITALFDFFVFEPIYMGLVLAYRWLTSEVQEIAPVELHPYEGEERFREDEN